MVRRFVSYFLVCGIMLLSFALAEAGFSTRYPASGVADASGDAGAPAGAPHDPYTGKRWNAVGDSITEQGKYMDQVRQIDDFTVVNCGLSSSTLAINNAYLKNGSIVERVCGLNGNAGYADADVWTVMGGVNDVLYQSALGQIMPTGTAFDNTTVYGALQSICEHILATSAHPRLILMTPTQSVRDEWDKETYGITVAEIRRAIFEVGEYYALPVLDTWALSGINQFNLQREENPTTDDGVHPTELGSELMAVAVARALEAVF